MRKIGELFALAVLGLGAPITAAAAPCAGFTDVDDSSGFCTSIAWVKNRGITLGCTTTSLYCPTAFVTREQMAAFLYRLGFNNGLLQGGNAFATTAVLGTTDNQPLDIRVNGIRVMRYEPNATSPNIVGGHPNNSASAMYSGQTVSGGGEAGGNCVDPPTGLFRPCSNRSLNDFAAVAGGKANVASGTASIVAGGEMNTASGYSSTVAGGEQNIASGNISTVAGGQWNVASGSASTIAGGFDNTASAQSATVAGGASNIANNHHSTIGGGEGNTASGRWSTIAGGEGNEASGFFSFAAGRRAKASAAGSFVWADSTNLDFPPALQANFFAVRATGGVGFTVKVFSDGVPEQFCNYLPNTAGWVCTSDREAKENLVPVDAAAVLDRLTTMPLFYWNFKGAGAEFRNLGPTAQDFQAAFGLSRDDKTIASGHVEGVALAAIQGLNVKLEQREAALRAEVQAKDTEIAAVKRELAELRTAQHREVAELRLAIEVLMARTSAERRVAQSP